MVGLRRLTSLVDDPAHRQVVSYRQNAHALNRLSEQCTEMSVIPIQQMTASCMDCSAQNRLILLDERYTSRQDPRCRRFIDDFDLLNQPIQSGASVTGVEVSLRFTDRVRGSSPA